MTKETKKETPKNNSKGILPSIRPLTTVDISIFTIINNKLHVLLVTRPNDAKEPYPNMLALPGGFIDVEQDKDLESCALRKLRDKTNLRSPYLEQVGSWGGIKRDPRGWSTTHVYFALLPHNQYQLKEGGNASSVDWYPIEGTGVRKKMAFDHAFLLEQAVSRLRSKAEYTSLPVHLLDKTFTLTELQQVYEIVLGRTLDKSAFRTRMLSVDFIEPTDQLRVGSNRPAQIYKQIKNHHSVTFPRMFKSGE